MEAGRARGSKDPQIQGCPGQDPSAVLFVVSKPLLKLFEKAKELK